MIKLINRHNENFYLLCVPCFLTVTTNDTTTEAGLLSCICMGGGSDKLSSFSIHELVLSLFGIMYTSLVKFTSITPATK